jgi:iron complex transport system substrate-binding protein
VGAPDGVPYGPWLDGQVERDDPDIEFAGLLNGQLPFEAIKRIDPDLIVGSTYAVTENDYDILSAIAPTISHDDVARDTTAGAWEPITRQVGAALGEKAEADRLIAERLGELEQLAARHAGIAGKKVVIAGYTPQMIYATLGSSHSGIRLLESLGLEQADLGASGDAYAGGRVELSHERLDLLDNADLLIIGGFSASDRDAMHDDRLFQALDVVADDRTLDIDTTGVTAFNTPTVSNIPFLIRQLEPYLARLDQS